MSAQHIFHELRRLVMGDTEHEQGAPQEETTPAPGEEGDQQDAAAPEEEQEDAPTDRMNAPAE